ncbi:PPP4R1 [Mytilus coruscus]|uniref:PPP4R1 n=1 Tax=Mytilus coruscus TaxID=42192 RepID=A0A6J8AVC7_MYTCO|nr:PPP4R1 [Mytilus coruscus]
MLLAKLKEKGTKIKSLGKTILPIKETLSDVQVFLATKSLGEKLRKKQKWISTLCNQNAAKESVLELSTDPQLKNLLSDVKYFGTIHVVRNPCQIETGAWEQPRAQLHVPITAVRDIDQAELELIREISFEDGSELRDCVIVNDGRMIFADFLRNKVLVYTRDGKLSKSIIVDKSPFGLALINPHTVAVTCVEDKKINIVNIGESVAKQKINVGKPCSWLSFNNAKLYALVTNTGIMEFDLGGNLIKTIPVNVLSNDGYLSSYKDIFCYTCYNSLMTCCDSNGKTIWESKIADSGVAVDNYGNYFFKSTSIAHLEYQPTEKEQNN